jgi:hypothetical protein
MLSLLLCTLLQARQLEYHVQKESSSWSFTYEWKDVRHHVEKASFSLPGAEIQADNAVPVTPRMKDLLDAQLQAVQQYARGLNGVDLKAWKDGDSIQMSVSSRTKGKSALKSALKGAQAAANSAADQWLADNGYIRVGGNTIMVDYTTIIDDYVRDLAPVAQALGAGKVNTGDEASVRTYVMRVLSFVQSIPYESRSSSGGDAGFRRPLSLIGRNKGDCDGKSALFLALIRAGIPQMQEGIVLVTDHAFAALAIPARKGDTTFKKDGVRYVVVEPVGPAVVRVGKPSSHSAGYLRSGNYTFKPVP